ncbi:MAG: hypothetical protein KAR57_01155 [Bacteroidales bacterium]|nr:hypothetical protein [Bacteroidales bacterium]
MKANIIFISFFSILLITGCSTYQASYETKPLKIDGSSSDWKTTLESRNNNSFSYGISNDKENLYIRININDQDIQRKLILAGFTVWIDTTGKKKENVGISCPIKKTLPKLNKNKIKEMKDSPEWNKNQLLESEFIGFKEYTETYFISQNPYGVEISIDQDKFKSLYYEMKIPFKSIYDNYTNISLKKLSIGLKTGALEAPKQLTKPTHVKDERSSSRGGRTRSGSGNGSKLAGGTPNSSMSSLTSPTIVWIKNIKLAIK